MMVAASVMVGAALEGMAYADTQSLVQVCVFAIGVGGGILNGATNALAADVSDEGREARLSLLGACFGIGALAMPTALALLSKLFALQAIVAGIGAISLLPAAFCLAIRFPPPKERSGQHWLVESGRMLLDPVFLLACLAMAIQSGMEGMSNDWTTRYFRQVKLAGQSDVERMAQLALIALTGGMFAARLLLAATLNRLSSGRVLMGSVGVAVLGAFILIFSEHYIMGLMAMLLIGAGLAAGFPVVLGMIGDRHSQQSGTAFSLIFVVALIGNMRINKSFGYVADRHGIGQYPKVLLGLLAGSAVLLLLVCALTKSRSPTRSGK
jgi:MFS family permease